MTAVSMAQRGLPRHPGRLRLLRAGTASDEALVRAHLDGDPRAFPELVERHQRLVHALVRRYARTADESADLVQKSFLRAFAAAGRAFPRMRLSDDGAFRAWLLRVSVNVAKNHARDSRRWRLEPVESVEGREGDAPGPMDRLEGEQRRALVRAALVKLTRRQRQVLTLRIDGDLPFAEVAAILGITENNAKVHFHHAVRRLREWLGGGLP